MHKILSTELSSQRRLFNYQRLQDIFRTHQDVNGVGVNWYLQCTVTEDPLEDALEVTIVVDVLVGWNDALVCCWNRRRYILC